MAALVRHDASAEAVLPPAGAKTSAGAAEIARLYDDLDRVNERDNPRTARLLACGPTKLAQKLVEEAAETALEAVRRRARGVVRESADLVYQLVVCGTNAALPPTRCGPRCAGVPISSALPKSCRNRPVATRPPGAHNDGGSNVLRQRIRHVGAPKYGAR